MKAKKLTKLILPIAACIPALASCGGGGNNVEEGATVITMYLRDFEDWSNEYMMDRIDEFNSILDDGIQLEAKFFEDEAYTDAFKVAKENNQAPEIFMCSYGNIFNDLVETGDAAPLNGLIKDEYISDIKDNVKKMVTYRGNVWGYPQLTEPSTLFFYRKSMLNKANVTLPSTGGLTWDWLLDACSKIKPTLKRGQYAVGIPLGQAQNWGTYGMQYNLTGGYALTDDWKQSRVASEPGFAELAGLWYDLYAGGYVPQGAISPQGSYNDIIEGMMMNKVAMTFAGSWSIAEIMHTYSDDASDVGVAVIPTKDGDTSKVTASNGGWTYAISSKADEEHKQKAAKVLEWFFAESPERTAGYFEAACYSKAAATKSVDEYISAHASSELKDWVTVVNDVATKAIPEATYPYSVSIAVGTMLEESGLATDKPRASAVSAAVANAEATIQKIITSPDFPNKPE